MCLECIEDHKDHSKSWIKGTNIKFYELFEQAVYLLNESKD